MKKFGILIASFYLFGCGGGSKSVDETPAAVSPSVSIVMGARTMGAMAYSPNPLTVAVGTTVVWTNGDTGTHTVTSDTAVFNSGNLAPGQTFSYTFGVAGTFPFHCNIHPSMNGSIIAQ